MSNFEKASRLQLRFKSAKGLLSIEDLWKLPLSTGVANLNDIAKELHSTLKNADEISFVEVSVHDNSTTQLEFDIVKHIIDVRLQENTEADKARVNRAKRAQIMSLIAQKENESLNQTSLDDLNKMLVELSA